MKYIFIYSVVLQQLIFYQNMDRFGLGFMSSQKDAQEQATQVMRNMNENGEFNKKYATEFLDAIYMELITPQTTPVSKVMTLHVLKELTYNAEVRFFSLLSSHKTLQFLFTEAKTVDPKKNVNEKGLKKFALQPETGRQYMALLLELTNFWGEKFARGKNSQATKFKKNLTQLKNLGVTLPINYEYFDPNQYKSKSRKSKQGGIASSNYMQASNETPSIPSGPTGIVSQGGQGRTGGKISNQLRYTKDKINLFIADLQDAQDPDNIQNLIHSNHSFFERQRNKYETRAAQVQQDEELMADYYSIQHFLTEEDRFYNKYIPVNDFVSYVSEIKLLNEQTFDKKSPTSRFPSAKPEEIKPLLATTQPVQTNTRTSQMNSQINNRALVSNLYEKLESRSKSPGIGFKNVGLQLQKQKQLVRRTPPKRNLSRSPNRTAGNLSTSNASNSSRIHPIFDNPPNRFVGPKSFEGQIIAENRDLARVLYNIKKEQGSRRFKISNFRQKNPLFQNEHIQVGYKSEAIYETVAQFTHFIMLNVYIGNKTEEGIKQFQIEYKADTNQLLYANPRTVDSIIPAGYQNKHDLMITPLSIPYSFMTMHISYKFNNTQVYTSIVLPNSVLKFASYMKISRTDFDNSWKNARKFKTNPFRLCKHLPPDTFNKWIPVLDNITRYAQFAREGSQIDLQMFCMTIMLQKYQAVLKINIRPNLDVVLQLGVLDNNPQGLEYFKFYLETLQLILKQTEM